MKHLFLFAFVTSFALQAGIVAQPDANRPTPRVEMHVQQLPSTSQGSDTEVRFSAPQIQADYRQNGRGDSNPPSQIEDNMPKQNIQRTLSIIKPDAVRNRHIGDIITRFENNGLHVAAIKMVNLTPEQAAQFYKIHRDRPFFKDLIQFMSSGPVVVMVLEGDEAVSKNRQLMGATDPSKAEKGTIRADFARSINQNAVHGSDSLQSANEEIPFFFKPNEIYSSY
jgi:nucleoside-diphosphate kinase